MKFKPIKLQPVIIKNLPFGVSFNKGYFLLSEVVVYGSLLDSIKLFTSSEEMKEFCEVNGISKDELKKVWCKDVKVIEL